MIFLIFFSRHCIRLFIFTLFIVFFHGDFIGRGDLFGDGVLTSRMA